MHARGCGCRTAGGLGLPPVDAPTLAIVGLTLGLAALGRAGSPGAGSLTAASFAAGLFGSVLSWSARFGAPAYLALAGVQALWFPPIGAVACGFRRYGRGRWAGGVAATWMLVEALRARWPVGGFEWGQLGYVWHELPVRSLAAVIGVLGVTGSTVGACAWVAANLAGIPSSTQPGDRRRRAATVALLAGVAGVATAIPWTAPAGTLAAVVVQIAPVCRGPAVTCPSEDADLLAAYVAQTANVTGTPDLLVWGEGALGYAPPEELGQAVVRAAGRLPAPLLAGTVSPASPGRWFNRNVLFGSGGDVLGSYAKRHPVPFGEYVPARALLGGIGDVGRLVPRDMEPGTTPGEFRVAGATLGTVSSFELSFAREMRAAATGSQAVVVPTLQASYGRSAVSDQLLAMAQLRAAELRKPVLVAATTGRSALVAAGGARGETTGLLSSAILEQRMQLRAGATPYERLGDGPAVLVALAVLTGPFLLRRVRGT